MTNLSDLFPAGAGKQVSFTADGNISAAGKPVILTAAGKAAPVAATAASMGTAADAGTGYRAGYTSGAAYHSTNNSTVLCFPDSANSYYATCTTATLSGTTMTMNTPTVINSTACHFVRCAYDATQNRVVFLYNYNC